MKHITYVHSSSKKRAEGETAWEAAERRKSRCIWVAGQKGLTENEAAIMIIEEARKLVQVHHNFYSVKYCKTPNEHSLGRSKAKAL